PHTIICAAVCRLFDMFLAQHYVGMADCYNLLREYSLMPPDEAYPRAAAAARRAIALDDSLPGAHSSLAFVDFDWYWDVPSAQREFKRALELDPSKKLKSTRAGSRCYYDTCGQRLDPL